METIWEKLADQVKQTNVPISMMIELTRKCNLKCIHCYNSKDGAELSFEQLDDIFLQLRNAGCLFLTLTGGELFTRPDALDIIARAREHGFDVKLLTNGTLITRELAKRLKEYTPSEIGVSLHGAKAETHEGITGVKGSFERSLEGMRILKAEGLPVHLKCTLMDKNISEYPDILKLSKELGVFYIVDPNISPKDDGSKDILKHRIAEGSLEKFYMEEFKSIEFESSSSEAFPCDAGRNFGSINALGDIYPCIQMPLAVGNIFQDPFSDVWDRSSVLKKIRSATAEDFNTCAGCDLSESCTRCPGLAFLESGDMFGPSQVACFVAGVHKKFTTMENKQYENKVLK